MDLALYKEFYDREWARHEHLQSAVNTPISIVTILAGGLVLMGKGFESADAALARLFWGSAGIAAALVAVSGYLLVRSIHGYRYRRLPFLSELARHHQSLLEYYDWRGTPGLAGPAFDEYLAKRDMAIADHNAVNNFHRGEYLYRANRFIVYALCATALAAVPAGIAIKIPRALARDDRITHLGSDERERAERRRAEQSGVRGLARVQWSGNPSRRGPT